MKIVYSHALYYPYEETPYIYIHIIFWKQFCWKNTSWVHFLRRFKREDSEIDNTGNEDSDDSAAAEEALQARSKKAINKGRWSKEEVSVIFCWKALKKRIFGFFTGFLALKVVQIYFVTVKIFVT